MALEFGLPALPRNLQAALRDVASRKVQVRRSAVRDLAAYVSSEAGAHVVQALEQLAERDPDIEVRAQAVLALADGNAQSVIGKLVQLASAAPARVRQVALLALGELAQLDDPAVVQAALDAACSELPALRYQGLVTLRHVQGMAAGETIAVHLTDRDDEVRWVAVRLLDELSVEQPGLPESALGSDATIQRLLPRIAEAAQDPVPKVAVAARLLLARLGQAGFAEELVKLLHGQCGHLDQHDEAAAIRMVGQFRVVAARQALLKRAWPRFWETPITFVARVALAELGDARAIAAILADLHSNSRIKCSRAIEPVGQLGLVAGRSRLRQLLENPNGYDEDSIRVALGRLGDR